MNDVNEVIEEVIERPKRAVKRWVKWLIRLILLIPISIIIISVIMGILLFTQVGLSSVTWTAQKLVSGLSIERSEGALLTDFNLHNLTYQDQQGLSVKINQVSYDMTLNCLFELSLCVDSLNVDGVNVYVPPSENEASEEESDPLVNFPFPMSLQKLQARNVSLDIEGNKVIWKNLTSGIELFGNTITLKPTVLDDIELTLVEGDEEQPQTSSQLGEAPLFELPEFELPWHFDLESLTVNRFALKGENEQTIDYLLVKASSENNALEIKEFIIQAPQGEAKLQGDLDMSGQWPLNLSLQSKLQLDELKGQELQLDASGSLADLTMDLALSKGIEAKLKANIELLDKKLPFELSLTQGQWQWPLTGKAQYSGSVEQLNAQGSLDGYQLSTKGQVQGDEVPKTTLDIEGKGDLNEFNIAVLKLDTLGGDISGDGMVNWQEPLNWKAKLAFNQLEPAQQWPDLQMPNSQAIINGSIENSGRLTSSGGWEVSVPSLDIQGRLRGQNINAKGSIDIKSYPKQAMQVNSPGLVVSHGKNQISIKGKLADSWDMSAKVNVVDLAQSIPDFKGKITGDVTFSGVKDTPSIKANLVASSLSSSPLQAKVDNIHLVGNVSPYPNLGGDVKLTVTNADYQGVQAKSLVATFAGEQRQHKVTLVGDVNDIDLNIDLDGGIKDKAADFWQGQINQASIVWQNYQWRNQNPVDLSYRISNSVFKLEPHCWANLPSKLCLNKAFSTQGKGAIDVSLEKFDLAQVNSFLDGNRVTGQIDAQIQGELLNPGAPKLTVKVTSNNGRFTQNTQSPVIANWNDFILNADLANNKLTTNWQLGINGQGKVSGDAVVTGLQQQNPKIQANNTINGLDLNFLSPLLGAKGNLQVNLTSNVKLSGDLYRPQVFGEASLNPIKATGELLPLEITQGQLTAKFNGYNATLNANIHTPDGQLDLAGDADWAVANAWRANMTAKGDRLEIEAPPMVRMQVTPDLKLSVTPQLAEITGQINIPWGRIVVEGLPPNAIRVSSDEILLDKDLKPIKTDTGFPMKLRTNVGLSLGNDVKIAAFGLRANLAGRLQITDKNEAPFVLGEIRLEKGTYQSFGQDLQIQEGKIVMNGPVDQPFLAIKAIRNPDATEDDVIAGITVSGPVDDPLVEVFSEPSMDQTSALSYLLRGKSIDDNSEGSAMTTALIGLSLARTGKLVNEIGNTFGVQDLQLGTAGSGDDSQVTVSGYITPDLQVKYGVGIFSSLGEFTARYRLFPDFYVEAVTGIDSAVDFIYQFSF